MEKDKKEGNPEVGSPSTLIFMKSIDYVRNKNIVMEKGLKNRSVSEAKNSL